MSICRNICKVDESYTFCVGCGRTLEEITEWYTATQERKKEIAALARERSRARREKALDELFETDSDLI